nr:hypothetical protein [Angustibacter aerolatus]
MGEQPGVVIGRANERLALAWVVALLAVAVVLLVVGGARAPALVLYPLAPAVVLVVVLVRGRRQTIVLTDDAIEVHRPDGGVAVRWDDLLSVSWSRAGTGLLSANLHALVVRPRGGPYAVPGPNSPARLAVASVFGRTANRRAAQAAAGGGRAARRGVGHVAGRRRDLGRRHHRRDAACGRTRPAAVPGGGPVAAPHRATRAVGRRRLVGAVHHAARPGASAAAWQRQRDAQQRAGRRRERHEPQPLVEAERRDVRRVDADVQAVRACLVRCGGEGLDQPTAPAAAGQPGEQVDVQVGRVGIHVLVQPQRRVEAVRDPRVVEPGAPVGPAGPAATARPRARRTAGCRPCPPRTRRDPRRPRPPRRARARAAGRAAATRRAAGRRRGRGRERRHRPHRCARRRRRAPARRPAGPAAASRPPAHHDRLGNPVRTTPPTRLR